jgi:hypothetical protein
MKDKLFVFNELAFKKHNEKVAMKAYTKAAKCTVNKINKILGIKDVDKAKMEATKFAVYLYRMYLEDR